MTTTRDKVLKALLKRPASTINELAEAVGINPISARHHVVNLQAQGLVVAEEEQRRGVGRPRLLYSLTEKGREQFPTRYLRLTTHLLSQIKAQLPPATLHSLFVEIASDLARRYKDAFAGLSLEERLERAKTLLVEEGFDIEWEKKGETYYLYENTCPYYQIGQHHHEICEVDGALLSDLLNVSLKKEKCLLDGDSRCAYVISTETTE